MEILYGDSWRPPQEGTRKENSQGEPVSTPKLMSRRRFSRGERSEDLILAYSCSTDPVDVFPLCFRTISPELPIRTSLCCARCSLLPIPGSLFCGVAPRSFDSMFAHVPRYLPRGFPSPFSYFADSLTEPRSETLTETLAEPFTRTLTEVLAKALSEVLDITAVARRAGPESTNQTLSERRWWKYSRTSSLK